MRTARSVSSQPVSHADRIANDCRPPIAPWSNSSSPSTPSMNCSPLRGHSRPAGDRAASEWHVWKRSPAPVKFPPEQGSSLSAADSGTRDSVSFAGLFREASCWSGPSFSSKEHGLISTNSTVPPWNSPRKRSVRSVTTESPSLMPSIVRPSISWRRLAETPVFLPASICRSLLCPMRDFSTPAMKHSRDLAHSKPRFADEYLNSCTEAAPASHLPGRNQTRHANSAQ